MSEVFRGKVGLAGLGLAVLLGTLLSERKRSKEVTEMIAIGDSDRERIVSLALGYLDQWHTLDADGRRDVVADLWTRSVGSLTGFEKGWPWSGAFVTAVVNSAAPGALLRSAKHTEYFRAAANGFGLYEIRRPSELPNIRPGDIVLKPRAGGDETFDDILSPAGFNSHADIVVNVTPHYVEAVGGNKTGGNIAKEVYRRSADGTLAAPVIAVLVLVDPLGLEHTT